MSDLVIYVVILLLLGAIFWYGFPYFLNKFQRDYPNHKAKCEYCGREDIDDVAEKGNIWFCCTEHEDLWNKAQETAVKKQGSGLPREKDKDYLAGDGLYLE